ncbi:uncharacterized protein TNCV_1220441 [Trichonephila clavipes]|nr:uncharacterized protein TNCV_1220441 [Trichonephila clavipes]
MSSVGYSLSPVHWSRWSSSILAWLQSGQAPLAVRPNQWRYTRKKSCPVVRRKRATVSAFSRCLGIGPTVARVFHGFPRLLVFWVTIVYLSMDVEIMLFALQRFQVDFRLG